MGLNPKLTFSNGVVYEVNRNDEGVLQVKLSGGPLQPLLEMAELTHLVIDTDLSDLKKLHQVTSLAINLAVTV